jgi:hypothetical protein
LQKIEDRLFIIVHREDEHFGLGCICSNLARYLNAIVQRQLEAEHSNNRLGFGCFLDGMAFRPSVATSTTFHAG